MSDDATTMSIGEATAALTGPGQMFEMKDIEIDGVALRAWKNAPASLRVVLDLSLARSDRDFLVYEDERTTFGEHYRIASTIAHRLRDEYGVEKGDRVAIAMRNLPEWVMAFWGAILAGAVVVPLNAWWTANELEFGLSDSASVVVFADEERLERIRPHLADLPALRAVVVACEDRGRPADLGDLLHVGDNREAEGGRRYPSQHVLEPHEPLFHQHPLHAALRGGPRGRPGEGPERVPALGAPLPRHRLPRHHDHQHRGRREARDDASLQPRARTRAHRA